MTDTAVTQTSTTSRATSSATRTQLTAGIVAGPLFIGLAVAQLLTREGFDIRDHPISLLSLGPGGWVQITSFVVAGLLSAIAALGVRRALGNVGPGRVWGPRLLLAYGVGLVAGGVFVADPGLGYPPGAPDGIPEQLTWHGLLHAVAPPVAFLSLIAAMFVVSRRFAADGRRGWAAASVATAVSTLVLSAWPDQSSAGIRLLVASTIGFAWLAAYAGHLRRRV
jgi:hypothetical membrane protein